MCPPMRQIDWGHVSIWLETYRCCREDETNRSGVVGGAAKISRWDLELGLDGSARGAAWPGFEKVFHAERLLRLAVV